MRLDNQLIRVNLSAAIEMEEELIKAFDGIDTSKERWEIILETIADYGHQKYQEGVNDGNY